MKNQELIEVLGTDALEVVHQAGRAGVMPGKSCRAESHRTLVGDGAVILIETEVTVTGFRVSKNALTDPFAPTDGFNLPEIRDVISERFSLLEFHNDQEGA